MHASVIALGLATSLFAGNDIQLSGKLVDESGAPISGASVALDGLATGTTTSADGTFSLAGSSSDMTSVVRRRALAPTAIVVRDGAVHLVGADAGSTWTLDVLRADGRNLAKGILFHDFTAALPGRLADRPILRVRRDGQIVSCWGGASNLASRTANADSYTLRFQKPGFAPERLGLTSLSSSNLLDTLVASDPWIPAGPLEHHGAQVKIVAKGKVFAMGSRLADDALTTLEGHRHSVAFTHDFWMDTTEVTQKSWQSVMSQHYGAAFSPTLMSEAQGLGDDYPVYSIYDDATWGAGGAILYANALSLAHGLDSVYTYTGLDGVGNGAVLQGAQADLTKNGYRLPTEAEWEYAARAGTTTDTWWGQDLSGNLTTTDSSTLSEHAVWAGNAFAKGLGNAGYGTHPVASKLASPYGLYDMIGNLSEWCHEAWSSGYESGLQSEPAGSSPSSEAPWHAIRGGDWGAGALFLRASNRTFTPPAYQFYFVGFRLVRAAS